MADIRFYPYEVSLNLAPLTDISRMDPLACQPDSSELIIENDGFTSSRT